MDLGIAGRKAIVCASSQGLGLACASAVAEGCHVVINGREPGRLAEAATAIEQATGGVRTTVAADIETEDGRKRLVEACPEADILVNNNRGPMPGAFVDFGVDDWLAAVGANMLAPLMMIGPPAGNAGARRFGRIVNITSAMVKSPRRHGTVDRRARPHGGQQGNLPFRGAGQRDHQQSSARTHRHRPPAVS